MLRYHDHILCYAINKDVWRPNLLPRTEEMDVTEEQLQKMRDAVLQEGKALFNKAEYQVLKGLTSIFKKARNI